MNLKGLMHLKIVIKELGHNISAKGPPKRMNSDTIGNINILPKVMFEYFPRGEICFKNSSIDTYTKNYDLNK